MHLRDGLRRYGIPISDIRTRRRNFMSIIATILYCLACDPRSTLYATSDAAPDYAEICVHFDTYHGRNNILGPICGATKHRIRANHGGLDRSVLPSLRGLRFCKSALQYAKFVVTFATHFCHYWSSMELNQRHEAVECVDGVASLDWDRPDDGACCFTVSMPIIILKLRSGITVQYGLLLMTCP